jgi:hypothetical protein
MKLKLILGAILLSMLVFGCKKTDLSPSETASAAKQSIIETELESSSPRALFEKELNESKGRIIKKLEKQVLDDKISSGDITLKAALPEIPVEDVLAVVTDEDVLEFVSDLFPAAFHFLVQEFQIDCSGYEPENIVNAAIAGNYYLQTVDSLIGYELDTVNMTYTYYRPTSLPPDSPVINVIDNCLRAALLSVGYDVGKATFTASIVATVSKQTIKQLLLSALGAQITAAIAPIILAWITFDTIWCVSAHYLTPVEE